MGALLFSPNGNISPAQFLRGAYVLILLTILVNALPFVSVEAGGFVKVIFFPVVFYCWTALFMKRFRRGGKPAVMCLLPAGVFALGFVILSSIIQLIFGGELYAEYQAAMVVMVEEGLNFGGMMEISEKYAAPLAKQLALPWAFAYAVFSALIIWVFNAAIPDKFRSNASTFE